jgi:hypothetical protein
VSDWNTPGPVDGEPEASEDVLAGVDWDGAPAYSPAEIPVPDAPAEEPLPPSRRRGAKPTAGQGNHSMGMRMSRGAFWGFFILALIIGLAVGGGALVWQRTTLLSDVRSLETRLAASEASMTAAAQELANAQPQLAAAQASVADLTSQNTQLTSDLATATAALAAAKSSTTTGILITERTATPASVVASHTLTLQVKVQGTADKVQMKIVGTGSVSSYSQTFNLTKSTTTGGIVTWRRTTTAPGKKGVYRYYATAYVGTKKTEMAGVSAWTFTVK